MSMMKPFLVPMAEDLHGLGRMPGANSAPSTPGSTALRGADEGDLQLWPLVVGGAPMVLVQPPTFGRPAAGILPDMRERAKAISQGWRHAYEYLDDGVPIEALTIVVDPSASVRVSQAVSDLLAEGDNEWSLSVGNYVVSRTPSIDVRETLASSVTSPPWLSTCRLALVDQTHVYGVGVIQDDRQGLYQLVVCRPPGSNDGPAVLDQALAIGARYVSRSWLTVHAQLEPLSSELACNPERQTPISCIGRQRAPSWANWQAYANASVVTALELGAGTNDANQESIDEWWGRLTGDQPS